MDLRPCHTRTCGRGEVRNANDGWRTGGGELVVVHIRWPGIFRIVVCDRGVGRSITVAYVLGCTVGWMAFDGGDTSLACVQVRPKLWDHCVGEMPEATAVIREATAVLDQLICRDHVNLFHLCVQARGSGSDEVGGTQNACVQGSNRRCNPFIQFGDSVRDEVGSSRDAVVQVAEGINSRRDSRILVGETRAERLSIRDAFVEVTDDSIVRRDVLNQSVNARAKRLESLETTAQGIKTCGNAIKPGINVGILFIEAGIYPANRGQDPVQIGQCGRGDRPNPCGVGSQCWVPEVGRGPKVGRGEKLGRCHEARSRNGRRESGSFGGVMFLMGGGRREERWGILREREEVPPGGGYDNQIIFVNQIIVHGFIKIGNCGSRGTTVLGGDV